ncbi:glutamine amidotransferase [Kribbella orskensis]|uniref:Gamma-glutamyl-hercynylcysteine sulfoxide hydrolase n=1 Tax=Kribbella orskensis TaxID=2512216 RepID=A0ABY2BHM4_9ACTN|nr:MULTISPECIES: ergothioneine biosynthesis protein EgtC [Kribbella]TCN38461.1 glutamine amidotransferase [Kribbella sp. VKM Ac-2500]TCO20009.1 glutamine amidotransferase [Kribbella orskensis]
MCRHLAYLGPPVSLASLVLEPPHSLYRQSWAPSDMRGGGSVNADGFGLGWYVDGAAPVRYRRSVPIWADESLPGLARSIQSGAVLAAVRNGTVGSPLTESAVAPFVRDQWLFSHNGLISGWPGSISKLAEALPVSELLTLDAPMDSALLWALIQDRLYSGSSAAEAVASVVREVAAAAPESRLNVLLTDGEQLVATTWTHSLWVRRTTDSVTVSSEPWTTDGWEEVPDYSLLLATATTVAITPLAPGPQELPMEGRQCTL